MFEIEYPWVLLFLILTPLLWLLSQSTKNNHLLSFIHPTLWGDLLRNKKAQAKKNTWQFPLMFALLIGTMSSPSFVHQKETYQSPPLLHAIVLGSETMNKREGNSLTPMQKAKIKLSRFFPKNGDIPCRLSLSLYQNHLYNLLLETKDSQLFSEYLGALSTSLIPKQEKVSLKQALRELLKREQGKRVLIWLLVDNLSQNELQALSNLKGFERLQIFVSFLGNQPPSLPLQNTLQKLSFSGASFSSKNQDMDALHQWLQSRVKQNNIVIHEIKTPIGILFLIPFALLFLSRFHFKMNSILPFCLLLFFLSVPEIKASPMKEGIKAYRALDYLKAEQEFSKVSTAFGLYNLGNALAFQHRLKEAKAAYLRALQKSNDQELNKRIEHNLLLVNAQRAHTPNISRKKQTLQGTPPPQFLKGSIAEFLSQKFALQNKRLNQKK